MMVTKSQSNLEADATSEQGAINSDTGGDLKASTGSFGFLDAAAKRAFSESEVSQSIVIRFLVEKVEESKHEIALLKPFQARYLEADKDLQIERSKNKKVKSQEIVSLALTTIGGAGMGLAIKFSTNENYTIAIPAFLLFAGIVAAGVYLKVAAK